MALLTDASGRSLDLTPVSYQYPDHASQSLQDWWDANWLNVRVAVKTEARAWSCTDPAFINVELSDMVMWVRVLAEGTAPKNRVFEALEPCLQFEAIGEGETLRIRALFQLEYGPPGLPFAASKDSPAEADDEDIVVEFRPGLAGLRAFADALERELEPFPVRGQRPY